MQQKTRRSGAIIRAALLMAAIIGISTILTPVATAEPQQPTLPFGTPWYTVWVNKPNGHHGYVFYTTGMAVALPIPVDTSAIPSLRPANIIADKSGREVWRYTPPNGQLVADFRPQTYRGRTVLTWWQGDGTNGIGSGVHYMADTRGHVIKVVRAGAGLTSDLHEFLLTPDGRALIISYVPVRADLTPVGGPRNGTLFDCVASVIDVASGKALMRWSAVAHIPLTESTMPLGAGSTTYDAYHMNSVSLDPSGDLLISFRNLNAVYDVDIRTGRVKWQLGGKHPSLAMGPGTSIAGQHDAQFTDARTVRVFDNNEDGNRQLGYSRIKWIRIDPARRTARLVGATLHPAGLASLAMGNAQGLPGGGTFGGWGSSPHISEFSPSGELVYDATLPIGTYRAYLGDWP
ncbi:arylsulfotransferase family protein [Gordonia sp. NPDC003424]